MALGDLWSRTLVYFGIAEEDDDWEDEDGYIAEESLEQSYSERPNVRRLDRDRTFRRRWKPRTNNCVKTTRGCKPNWRWPCCGPRSP